MDRVITADDSRRPFSHVNRDGLAKQSLESERAAIAYAGQLRVQTGQDFGWYVCSQRPEHWHVARRRA